MRTIRLHLVAVLLALIGIATSLPQPPFRQQGSNVRNTVQVQLDDDDDDDDREGEVAILEEEATGERTASERRRRA